MKLQDLISKPDRMKFITGKYGREAVLVEEKGITYMFHIPHRKFDMNLEIIPVFWHKLTGKYFPIVVRPDWAEHAPIVYIES